MLDEVLDSPKPDEDVQEWAENQMAVGTVNVMAPPANEDTVNQDESEWFLEPAEWHEYSQGSRSDEDNDHVDHEIHDNWITVQGAKQEEVKR